MKSKGNPDPAKAHLHMGRLLNPAEFADHCRTFPEGARKVEGWALTVVLPDAVVLPFERPAERVAIDVLWLASPQDIAYLVLAMQVGDLQLRAFAPLSDSRVAEWAREIHRRGQLNLAVEVESPRRLAVFEARCTSLSEDAIEQALNSSRGLSREERAHDLVQATKRMCMPSAVSDTIPGRSPKELYVIAVESVALKEAFIHFGFADDTGE